MPVAHQLASRAAGYQISGASGPAGALVIRKTLKHTLLARYRGIPKSMMDFLCQSTYRLSLKPLIDLGYGFEFEDRHTI